MMLIQTSHWNVIKNRIDFKNHGTGKIMDTLKLEGFDLKKTYGGRTVVKGVSLEVSQGEIVGL